MNTVKGRTMELGATGPLEREFIFGALQSPDIHVPLGLREAPTRDSFERDFLTLARGDEVREEPVRYHTFRTLDGTRALGFVVDFGWETPNDSVREIDLAFPNPADRNLLRYFDSSILIAQYLFKNRLAKRFRWRVESKTGEEPRRSARQGGRLVTRQEERHPVTGEWRYTYIYEFSKADFERVGEDNDFDPYLDYGELEVSMWGIFARR
ncbi:MAG: hypothetical protein AAFQ82_02965 [Myxococcota bacterium]